MEYLKQREKIVQAYFKNKLNPYSGCACFVGNLLNNTTKWTQCRVFTDDDGFLASDKVEITKLAQFKYYLRNESNSFYTPEQIIKLETNFLKTIRDNTVKGVMDSIDDAFQHPNYEEALFKAMDSTLDLLLEIHIANGDKSVIELEKPVFVKRELKLV